MLENDFAPVALHQRFGAVRRWGPLTRCAGGPEAYGPGVLAGAETESILREIGRSSEQIAELQAARIVWSEPVEAPSQRCIRHLEVDMGLRGEAAIVGITEWKPERRPSAPPIFTLEQWAQLTREALADAGIDPADVDGICATNIRESDSFVPSTITEYLGLEVNFAEVVDLGGASCAAMVWRAAAAIELGAANVVVIAAPSWPSPRPPDPPAGPNSWRFGASSANYGSPQASSTFPTAMWRRTAATRRSQCATARSTATTPRRSPKSQSTSGSAPTTTRPPSSTMCQSRLRMYSTRR